MFHMHENIDNLKGTYHMQINNLNSVSFLGDAIRIYSGKPTRQQIDIAIKVEGNCDNILQEDGCDDDIFMRFKKNGDMDLEYKSTCFKTEEDIEKGKSYKETPIDDEGKKVKTTIKKNDNAYTINKKICTFLDKAYHCCNNVKGLRPNSENYRYEQYAKIDPHEKSEREIKLEKARILDAINEEYADIEESFRDAGWIA